MSNSSFLSTDLSVDNPNLNYSYLMDNLDLSDFEVSDYLLSDHRSAEDSTSAHTGCDSTNNLILPKTLEDLPVTNGESSSSTSSNIKCKGGVKKNKMNTGYRIAFRTKTELEIMDDGYKWRKYGKKTVKNSPNPRNYYRCSNGGCQVKKRVERDGMDSSYVITTYEGVHNHESPSLVYNYNQMPLTASSTCTGWSLQATHYTPIL